jgi:hypothetical protein
MIVRKPLLQLSVMYLPVTEQKNRNHGGRGWRFVHQSSFPTVNRLSVSADDCLTGKLLFANARIGSERESSPAISIRGLQAATGLSTFGSHSGKAAARFGKFAKPPPKITHWPSESPVG